jgi:ribonuclease D
MAWEASHRIDRLKAWRAEAAAKVNLDPGVLLPQRLIERIAIDNPRTPDVLANVPAIRRWRVGEFGSQLLAAVAPPTR